VGGESIIHSFNRKTGKEETNRETQKWISDNIKINLIEMFEGVDWIHLTHDRDHWQTLVDAGKKLENKVTQCQDDYSECRISILFQGMYETY
jgi:hypothetical protein